MYASCMDVRIYACERHGNGVEEAILQACPTRFPCWSITFQSTVSAMRKLSPDFFSRTYNSEGNQEMA